MGEPPISFHDLALGPLSIRVSRVRIGYETHTDTLGALANKGQLLDHRQRAGITPHRDAGETGRERCSNGRLQSMALAIADPLSMSWRGCCSN